MPSYVASVHTIFGRMDELLRVVQYSIPYILTMVLMGIITKMRERRGIEGFTVSRTNWIAVLFGDILITNKTDHTLIAFMSPGRKMVIREKNINANVGVSATGVDVGFGYAIKNDVFNEKRVQKIAIGPMDSITFHTQQKKSYLTLECVADSSTNAKFTICEDYEVKRRCEYLFENKHFESALAAFF